MQNIADRNIADKNFQIENYFTKRKLSVEVFLMAKKKFLVSMDKDIHRQIKVLAAENCCYPGDVVNIMMRAGMARLKQMNVLGSSQALNTISKLTERKLVGA